MHPDTPAAVEWPRAGREWIDCGGWKIWFWRQGYGDRMFIGQTFQPCGVLSEQRGVEAGFQIGAADEVGFAAGMATGHPPPGEGVGRGIGIEQVLEEKVGAEFPGKLFVMDPPRGDPEASMVVEPSGLEQFTDEVIHDGDAGAAGGDVGQTGAMGGGEGGHLGAIGRPDGGVVFKPPFPVRPPEDFLGQFFHAGERVGLLQRCEEFFLGDEATADGWRQPGDVWVAGHDQAAVGAVGWRLWEKSAPLGQGGFPGLRKHFFGSSKIIRQESVGPSRIDDRGLRQRS